MYLLLLSFALKKKRSYNLCTDRYFSTYFIDYLAYDGHKTACRYKEVQKT